MLFDPNRAISQLLPVYQTMFNIVWDFLKQEGLSLLKIFLLIIWDIGKEYISTQKNEPQKYMKKKAKLYLMYMV